MTLQVLHPVVDWYLGFDDLWELMRVNWQTHNTFTQSGMWSAEDYEVKGLPFVVDSPPYRGVLLAVEHEGILDYVTIVTYGPKCNECGYQPYNAFWYGGDDDGALQWAADIVAQAVENAQANGVERLHTDECSHLTYPDEEGDTNAEGAE